MGKLADLVLWKPSFFGAKPEMVIKGGEVAWANMGDANASIPTPEPVTFYILWFLFLFFFRFVVFASNVCFQLISGHQ